MPNPIVPIPQMRVFGRTTDEFGNRKWVVVTTDANGFNDYVYLTALAQEIQLNLNESPFYGNRGIPAEPSVVSQVAPDYYSSRLQLLYSPFFMNIMVYRVPGLHPLGLDPKNTGAPVYKVQVVTHQGVTAQYTVAFSQPQPQEAVPI
jgi:hypothetical protein